MPTYTYRCANNHTGTAYRSVAERDRAPKCTQCGKKTKKVITSTMVSVFTPYRTVAHDKDSGTTMLIRTQKEHQAFLNRNGYEEVGNDKSMAPLSPDEIAQRRVSKEREAEEAMRQPIFDFNEQTHEASFTEETV